MTNLLEAEMKCYADAKERLLGQHEGQFVLIHGANVLGTFESQNDAVNHGYEVLGNVPFLVKKIERIEQPVNFVSYRLAI